MFTKAFLAVAACGILANAHMIMNTPVPYGKSTLDNSPLEYDGSDFPCKQRSGVYDITSMNNMAVGETQALSFIGGATHGGGSCQVSVTTDKQPTTKSEWKVIHSIIGGCPSNATGNLSDDADGTDASVFEFSMPKGMANGEYSLAWTWFNKIGNREMYMNCAPITVTGGAASGDMTFLKSLPDMFVMNIPQTECTSVEGEDFVFPSPGDSVETAFSTALGSSTVGTACASVMAQGAGAGTLGAVAAASTGAVTSAVSASSAVVTSASSPATSAAESGIIASSAGNAPITITTLATVTGGSSASAVAPAPSAAAPVASGSTSSNGTSSGSCSSGAVSCTSPGSVVCIGSNQWGLCDINNCAVPQALADGTSCSDGTVSRKRSVRHQRKHLGAHRHSS